VAELTEHGELIRHCTTMTSTHHMVSSSALTLLPLSEMQELEQLSMGLATIGDVGSSIPWLRSVLVGSILAGFSVVLALAVLRVETLREER
jgi:hypothetical protein